MAAAGCMQPTDASVPTSKHPPTVPATTLSAPPPSCGRQHRFSTTYHAPATQMLALHLPQLRRHVLHSLAPPGSSAVQCGTWVHDCGYHDEAPTKSLHRSSVNLSKTKSISRCIAAARKWVGLRPETPSSSSELAVVLVYMRSSPQKRLMGITSSLLHPVLLLSDILEEA